MSLHTEIENAPATECVQAQGGVACWAVLRLCVRLFDIFVEASLVGDVAAGELEDPLAAQGMLKQFLASSTFTTNEGPLPPRPRAVGVHQARHGLCCARHAHGRRCRKALVSRGLVTNVLRLLLLWRIGS